MALVSKPFTYSNGAIIYASQANSNFDTIYNDYNGNITNANISAAAGIAYSKLTLSGSIMNSDISSSAAIVASKIDFTSASAIGSTSPSTGKFTTLEATSTFKLGTTNQGDILYDNGTSLVRLVPGTSGQFLKTQGSSANPVWGDVTDVNTSNALFQLQANVSNASTDNGVYQGTDLTPGNGTTCNYQFIVTDNTSLLTVAVTKFKKIAGISTVTVYVQIWGDGTAGDRTIFTEVDIGGQTGTTSSTATSPTWVNFTVDVSGLSNGTVYDVSIKLRTTVTGFNAFLGNLIAFGS